MKFMVLISLCTLLVLSLPTQATPKIKSSSSQARSISEQWITQIRSPKISTYTYMDNFNFESIKGPLFNRYHGHTHSSALGEDNIKIYSLVTGLYITHYDTDLLTSSKLGPLLTESNRTTQNNGFYLHATKNLINHVQVEFFGGYGHNKFNLRSTIETERLGSLTGYSKYYGHDELGGFRGLFTYYTKQFFLQSDVDYFYARFNQPDYTIFYPNNQVTVPQLITSVGTYIENAKLSYFLNDYFSPFLTGTLIQVGSRSFSRPVISLSTATSPLPELTIAKNGYAYGGGLMFKYKKIILTTSYKHENRKNIYISNVYLLKLDWAIA